MGRAEPLSRGVAGNSTHALTSTSATCLSSSLLRGPPPSLPHPRSKNLHIESFFSHPTSHIQSVGTAFKIHIDSVFIKYCSKMYTLYKQ